MKKAKRLVSLITAALIAATLIPASVSAAEEFNSADMGSPEFVFGSPAPTWSAKIDDDEIKKAAVEYGEFSNDGGFVHGWYHKQKNIGQNSYDNHYFKFSFDTSSLFGADYEVKPGDIIYLSYYMKNESSFELKGETLDGTANPSKFVNYVGANKSGDRFTNIKAYDEGKSAYTPFCKAPKDDAWHKYEYACYITKDIANAKGKLDIFFAFQEIKENRSIKIADFTIGKFNFDSSKTYADSTNDKKMARGFDYLCHTLDGIRADAKFIASDGHLIEVTNTDGVKDRTYDAYVSSDEPEIFATNSETKSFKTKLAGSYVKNGDKLNLTVSAPSYDRTLPDGGKAKYIKIDAYTDNNGNSGSVTGTWEVSSENSAYKEDYILNVKQDYRVFAPSGAAHNIGGSDSAKYRNTYVKYKDYQIDEQALENEPFQKGYVMETLKNTDESVTGSVSKDQHYFHFDFDTNSSVGQYDWLIYSM